MKKFLVHTLLMSILISGILIVADLCVTNGLRKSHSSLFDNMTRIFEGSINADLIINGSSRARNQISPQILDSMLSINSYNIGQDGTGFRIQNLMYDLYRRHNKKPDYIIHVIGNETLEVEDGLYEHVKFAPYLDDSLVRHATMGIKGFRKLDYYVPFLRYSGFPDEVMAGASGFFGLKSFSNENIYKGYRLPFPEWNNFIFEQFKNGYPDGVEVTIDTQLIESMKVYIQNCKKEDIDIILVYPPTYYEAIPYFHNEPEILKTFKTFAVENKVLFLDYSNDTLSQSKKYFADHVHLNKKGAEIFTKKLILDLKGIGNIIN